MHTRKFTVEIEARERDRELMVYCMHWIQLQFFYLNRYRELPLFRSPSALSLSSFVSSSLSLFFSFASMHGAHTTINLTWWLHFLFIVIRILFR